MTQPTPNSFDPWLTPLPHILEIPASEYVGDGAEAPVLVDCSFGVNPFGYSPRIKPAELAHKVDFSDYPPFPYTRLTAAILEYWRETVSLSSEHVTVCAGSMLILNNLFTLFTGPGRAVLGLSPQFPPIARSVAIRGGEFVGVPLKPESRYAIDVDVLIAELQRGGYSVAYLDNPHNPTGQIVPLPDVERLAQAAQATSSVLIVDEAYGDYMSDEESAISLVPNYNNLYVIRSFSKGQGLASMRIGYVVAGTELSQIYGIVDDFLLNPIGLEAAEIALSDREFMDHAIERTQAIKGEVLDRISPLVVAATDARVPIFLLQDPDESVDLYAKLLDVGVKSSRGYDGIGSNEVRLRIPDTSTDLLAALGQLNNEGD